MLGSNREKWQSNQVNIKNLLKRFFTNSKISRIALFFLLLFLLFHYFTDHFFKLPFNSLQPQSDSVYTSYKLRDLKHIDELKRIKKSVSTELRDLENRRNQLQNDISIRRDSLTSLEQIVKKAQSDLDKLKREIVQLKNEQREAAKPKMLAPARLLATDDNEINIDPPEHFRKCTMSDCFDYSRCSLTSQFPVYVYPLDVSKAENSIFQVTPYITKAVQHAISNNPYLTTNPSEACLYVVVLGETEGAGLSVDGPAAGRWLKSLSHWRGDGRNHLLLYLNRQNTVRNPLRSVDTGRALVAQSIFAPPQFRCGFDVIVPTLSAVGAGRQSATSEQEVDHVMFDQWKSEDEAWQLEDLPPQVPAMRSCFLSFQGQWTSGSSDGDKSEFDDPNQMEKAAPQTEFHKILLETLKSLKLPKSTRKSVSIDTSCPEGRSVVHGHKSEWSMCGTFSSRASLLSQSTFALILPPEKGAGDSVIVSPIFLNRLAEALRVGAIPVIFGSSEILPFSEFIEWEKAAVVISQSRVTELPLLLHNLPHEDVLFMRRRGRFLFETYFSSSSLVLSSVLSLIRSRLQIPPLPVEDVECNVVKHDNFPLESRDPSPGDAKSEFGFPPSEPKIDSRKFRHNFTRVLADAKEMWNAIPGPFRLYPSLPNDRTLPTDAQFIGSSDGFRPIGGGVGGTGRIYQESLGGNYPREQFTIVMLTYKRDDVLIQAIERLSDLPHLNKVIVVWNAPEPPSDELRWPDIGVEVAVVHAKRNSLNNRFVPWNIINTDAVLSIDDDAHLRHDEILFGFRVWRQNRDRVVGFPGRFHAWDENKGKWAYNSNHTCELSMVLTGAAFVHKYYMFLYTYWLPAAIRDTVDELMNCEDIAMNFLVSHVTRQPPIKVTSRWTFRCPGCPVALSQSDEHFMERHQCINRFVKIFGYMPLIFTQYRVDSILFKTRLPHDKQKCFKFI